MNEHVSPTMNTNIAPRVRCLPLRFTARPSRPIPLPAAFKRRLPALPHLLLALLLLAGINPLLSAAFAAGGPAAIVPVLVTVFTNPSPAVADSFGFAVAAVGNNRVLIGAPLAGAANAGAAYLFLTNGILLKTFTNPTPATADNFGFAVAAAGNNRVLIGAPFDDTAGTDAGAAYLFNTSGDLLTTFSPSLVAYDYEFASSVAALPNDRVVIGAPLAFRGLAYVFGAMGGTIANPRQEAGLRFGRCVAAMGSDCVLIGAPADVSGRVGIEAAYLVSIASGLPITTFHRPGPGSDHNFNFGRTLAALGNDRVLIGAPYGDSTAAAWSGVAYLFNTNGTLLTTFTNPTPATNDGFGISVAVVGSDRVLIGAHQDDTGATNAGAAYLFSTNGTLLATFTQPTPTAEASFGTSVAALGSDLVLIGSHAGAAYLFALVPSLDIHPTPAPTLAVSWPLFAPDYFLQQNTNGLGTGNWSNVTDTVQDDGTNKYIIVDPATGSRFYRLIKP